MRHLHGGHGVWLACALLAFEGHQQRHPLLSQASGTEDCVILPGSKGVPTPRQLQPDAVDTAGQSPQVSALSELTVTCVWWFRATNTEVLGALEKKGVWQESGEEEEREAVEPVLGGPVFREVQLSLPEVLQGQMQGEGPCKAGRRP